MTQTDGWVLLTKDYKEVAEVTQQLKKYCVDEPVKCPLIFAGKPQNMLYNFVIKYSNSCSII